MFGFRFRPNAQARVTDERKRSFRADDQLQFICAWSRQGIGGESAQRTTPVDRAQRQHHVFDLSVATGKLPRTPASQPAAERAANDRRWKMTEGEIFAS